MSKRLQLLLTVAAVITIGGFAIHFLSASSQTCAQTLLSGKLCGHDLTAFCKERYDPAVNADTCDQVLADAGIDSKRLLADRTAHAAAAADAKRQAAQHFGSFGKAASLGSLQYTIVGVEDVLSIQPSDGFSDPISPRAGRKFVRAHLSYLNVGSAAVEPLCGVPGGFRLTDAAGREYSPDELLTAQDPANSDACTDLQPGDRRAGSIIFDVRQSLEPAALVVWDDSGPPPIDGGTNFVYSLATSSSSASSDLRVGQAFTTPTGLSTCEVLGGADGSNAVRCGLTTGARGYQLAQTGRPIAVAWRRPVGELTPVHYGTTYYMRDGHLTRGGTASDLQCVVHKLTGVGCSNGEEHGFELSAQHRGTF